MTTERGGYAYNLLPTDLAEARAEGRPPREGLIRGGGSVGLRTDDHGELFMPMAGEERAHLASLSDDETLELELAARARTLARPPVSTQPLEACSYHGFVHESSLAWQRRDIEALYAERAGQAEQAEAARRAADQE
jgi:hypothetical protein